MPCSLIAVMSSALRQLARRAAPQLAAIRGGHAPASHGAAMRSNNFIPLIIFHRATTRAFARAYFHSPPGSAAAHDDHHDDHGHHSYYPSPVRPLNSFKPVPTSNRALSAARDIFCIFFAQTRARCPCCWLSRPHLVSLCLHCGVSLLHAPFPLL